MARSSLDHHASSDPEARRAIRLLSVSEQLESVLESLDLDEQPALAEEVIKAVQATDRAYDLETKDGVYRQR
jgi:hypothetical protein